MHLAELREIIRRYRFELVLVAVIVAISLVAVFFGDRFGIFSDRQKLQSYIENFGIWGRLVLVGISAIEVIIAPLPGGISPIAAGFVYGRIEGWLLVLLGNVIGANITFWIARLYGERFFLLFIKKSEIDRFQSMVDRRQKFLWAAYFIPVLPYDVINIAIGLSDKISWKKFVVLNAAGMSVSMFIITFFGSSLLEVVF